MEEKNILIEEQDEQLRLISQKELDEIEESALEFDGFTGIRIVGRLESQVGVPKPNTICEKNVCANCKHLGEYVECKICNNPKIRLWNLSNCEIPIKEWGCTFFEQREA